MANLRLLALALLGCAGGAMAQEQAELYRFREPLIPVTIDPGSRDNFQQLLVEDPPVNLSDPALPDGHTNFYRSDDVSAVAYFYLDRPENGLPRIASGAERMKAIRHPPKK
jgi:hypothetical protein